MRMIPQDEQFMVSDQLKDRIDFDSMLAGVRDDAQESSKIAHETTRDVVLNSLFRVIVTLLDEEERAGELVSFVKKDGTRSITLTTSDRIIDDIMTSEIVRIVVASGFADKSVLDVEFVDDDQPNVELYRVGGEYHLTLSYNVVSTDILST